MTIQKHPAWSRREFLRGLSIATGVGFLGLPFRTAAAEPFPETTTIRVLFDPDVPVLCFAPQYVAKQFLSMEGFTDVQYVPHSPGTKSATVTVAENGVDITAGTIPGLLPQLDAEKPIVILGGLHAGCYELFARKEIKSIKELKNKRVAVTSYRGVGFNTIASMLILIGFNIERDIEWVVSSPKNWAEMLEQGQVDAILALPPMSYAVRDKNIGHVILNTATDAPWRHYFCCMIAANREFVQNYPVATKRALRALLKANQLCSLEPERTARWLVDEGYTTHYDYAVKTLQDVNYAAWRDYDPEDSLRFYALRLREAGIIKSAPQKIIAHGTDWRFLNELKRELKA